MLKRIPKRNHITHVLKDLHWLKYMLKGLPIEIDESMIIVYPINEVCANSYFERSFSYAAPISWNRLDMNIRMSDFDHFKSRIKTELYPKYFED